MRITLESLETCWFCCLVAQSRWERLVGRLVAELAWNKIRVVLALLGTSLAFGEGCKERLTWLTEDKVGWPVSTDPEP